MSVLGIVGRIEVTLIALLPCLLLFGLSSFLNVRMQDIFEFFEINSELFKYDMDTLYGG